MAMANQGWAPWGPTRPFGPCDASMSSTANFHVPRPFGPCDASMNSTGSFNAPPNVQQMSFRPVMLSSPRPNLTPEQFEKAEAAERDALVNAVKHWQKRGHRYLWYQFCVSRGSAAFDPVRHDNQFLKDFLQHAQETDPANSPAPVENMATPRDEEELQTPMRPEDIMQRRALEHRVKDWQRKSPGHKLAWHAFCRQRLNTTNHDPCRHSVEGLTRFLRAVDQGIVRVEGFEFSLGKEEPLTKRDVSPHAGSRAMRESLKRKADASGSRSPSRSKRGPSRSKGSSGSSGSDSSKSRKKKKKKKKSKKKRKRSTSSDSSACEITESKDDNSASEAKDLAATKSSPDIEKAKSEALETLQKLRTIEDRDARMREWRALLRNWHPDKNPHQLEVATAVFQFLQKGKQLLG